MSKIAIIGGSGLTRLHALEIERHEIVSTPYGESSAAIAEGYFDGVPVIFLPRHGAGHVIPPHKVNYRANIWALKESGATDIIAVNAVGGISKRFGPKVVCVPDQLVDYTYNRENTYFDGEDSPVTHIDFTEPYCESLRQKLIHACDFCKFTVVPEGVYGVTQGPRLETAAEIRRMENDGCDIVGMTAMPEAALARELDMCYANLSLVVNWAAGKTSGPITMKDIEANLEQGMTRVRTIIGAIKP